MLRPETGPFPQISQRLAIVGVGIPFCVMNREGHIILDAMAAVKTSNSKSRPPGPEAITLETPIQYLKGVGPARSNLFRRLEIRTVRDLLEHYPKRHEDRRNFRPIGKLQPGEKAVVWGRVTGSSIFRAKTGTVIFRLDVRDASGGLTALWFNQPYMRRWFTAGQELILFGTAEPVGRKLQMIVPDFEFVPKAQRAAGGSGAHPKSLHMGRMVPIYPATSGLHQRELRSAVAAALKLFWNKLPDPLPEPVRRRHDLLDYGKALTYVHFPPDPQTGQRARERLTFDELLTFQMALALRRRLLAARPGRSHRTDGDLVERWKEALPFALTKGQERAITEIAKDMAAATPMRRLIQGEVGSGKTVVAAYGMVVAAQSGTQSVLLAPTEVLARQHALTLSRILSPVDLSVGLLTGSQEPAARQRVIAEAASGTLSVLVGTHALLEAAVCFSKLGLVIVDEQQKFGVDQRGRLTAKGEHPDLLILTATPIPRTLALTLYGEMAVSTIAEKPAGRSPVRTLWLDSTRREEAYAFVRKELEAGRQGFVVCPRIGKADPQAPKPRPVSSGVPGLKEDLFQTPYSGPKGSWATAADMFEEYKQTFSGFRVGLLHGQMSPAEQKEIFKAFKEKQIHLLVATQVIEVGVDVPDATVMVIEGADRFGLSQLHQLRGRVGRGTAESTCILMADPQNPEAVQRLETLVGTHDAFKIAEEDLRLRGPGELLGARQAGLPDLKTLSFAIGGPWLEITREEAERTLTADPMLADPAIQPIKHAMAVRFPKLVAGSA